MQLFVPRRCMGTMAYAGQTANAAARPDPSKCSADRKYQFLQESAVPTDKFQASLPRMPIPKLADTCRRYLDSQRPLLSESDFAQTKRLVEDFESGPGRELDSRLRARDRENKHTSYINGPWTDAYLRDKRPVVFTHDPGMLFDPKDSRPEFRDAAMRAANVLVSTLRFHKSYAGGLLKPEVFHLAPAKTNTDTYWNRVRYMPRPIATPLSYLMKAFPLDMSQHPNLFQSTRIPTPEGERDVIQRFSDSRHVLVMRKGHFYVFDVYDRDGHIFPPSYYLSSIRGVIQSSDNLGDKSSGVGALTGTDRHRWAAAREHLISLGNQTNLDQIDSALHVICLDDDHWHHSEETILDSVMEAIAGSRPENRWFDKSFGFTFSSTGDFGLRFEHSWGDGVAVMRLCDEVVNDSRENAWVQPGDKYGGEIDVRRLDIKTDDRIDAAAAKARSDYLSKLNSIEMRMFRRFGALNKTACKRAKVAPDSLMQVLLQIAYHRLTGGHFASTYESCSTAIYRCGRTETMRPLTMDAKTAAEAFNACQKPGKEELLQLLRRCSKTHSDMTAKAAQGQGWDRHMFALKSLAGEGNGGVPDVFLDPAYESINRIILSTSTLASTNFMAGGFCPVQPDGFGLPYQVGWDAPISHQ